MVNVKIFKTLLFIFWIMSTGKSEAQVDPRDEFLKS